jgi:hypothetical protein
LTKKKKTDIIPKLKKKLVSFAKSEKGKISKQSMVTVGSIVGGAAIGTALATKEARAASRDPGAPQADTMIPSSNSLIASTENSYTVRNHHTGEIQTFHLHHASY